MNRNGKLFRVAVLAVLVFALAVVSTGTMAQQPEGEVESIACGDNVSCNRSGWAARISNSGGGGVFLAEQDAYTVAIKGRGRPGVYGTSGAGIGVKGNSTNGAGVWGFSENDDGVYGKSNDDAGVHGRSLTAGAADHGVEGWTESENSTGEAGVYGENMGDDPSGSGPGVYGVGNADETGYGVRAKAVLADGLYAESNSSGYDFGGYFTGPAGIEIDTKDADADAVYAKCESGYACYALRGYSSTSRGVSAYTGNASNEWGLYSGDLVHALGFDTKKGFSFYALNGGDVELQAGDLVAVIGMGAPLPESDVPVMMVRRADAASATGIVGVVESAVQITTMTKMDVIRHPTEIPDEEGGEPDHLNLKETVERQVQEPSRVAGPATPGGLMVLTVQGLAQMKVDASAGAIQPGDLLTTGDGGFALKAQQVTIEGQAPFYGAGTIVGKALEGWADGQGLIWVLVDLR